MRTEKAQMRHDIEKHFTDKLHRWCRDCDQVCQAAEINSGETIILILLKVTLRSLQSAMPKSDFMELMSEGYDTAAKDNADLEAAMRRAAAKKTGRQL